MTTQTPSFYVTGGTVPRDAPSYVQRQADTDLIEGLRQGQFCYVLTSRQMGKSSLMARTAARLREEGVAVAVLDLTAVGQNLTPEQWYDGLLNLLARSLDLEEEMEAFWFAHERLSPLQRWMQGLSEVALGQVPAPIVVFIDEIDAVRSLPFSADEFFAAIRECYNRRVEEPSYRRLSFCLLGVASPSDLIRDTRNTPFNIGHRVEVNDFTPEEAAPLARGLADDGGVVGAQSQAILSRVLYWTGGHPYLTQRLCQTVAEALAVAPGMSGVEVVDRQCAELYLSLRAREQDDNLIFVRERLLRSEEDLAALLDVYGRVRQGKRVANEESSPLVSVLRLSGIVKGRDRFLAVRNRIYAHVFDLTWVRNNMPYAELWRQQAAYRRGVLRAGLVSAIILGLLVGLGSMAVWNRHTREAQQAAVRLASQQKQLAAQETRLWNEAKRQRDRANREAQMATVAQRSEHRERQAAEIARGQAEKAKRQAEQAFLEAETQRQRAVSAESLARQREFLENARSLRLSGGIGSRFDSLEALSKAAKLRMSPAMRMDLRNEAIACLSLPIDLRPVPRQSWHGTLAGEGCIGVKADGSGYYYSDAEGNITLRSLTDRHTVFNLPGFGKRAWIIVRHSRDGRYIGVRYYDNRVVVWDTEQRRQIDTFRGYYTWREFDFSPDGRIMVDISGKGEETVAHLRELPSGREYKQIPLHGNGCVVRFRPTGRKLAFGYLDAPQILIYDLDTEKRETRQTAAGTGILDWSEDGKQLAACCTNNAVYLWNEETGAQVATIHVHTGFLWTIAFNHRGDILASMGQDNTLCFCNTADGALLMRCSPGPTETIEFSPDDRYFVSASDLLVQRWRVAPAFNVMAKSDALAWNGDVAIHPNGLLATVAAHDGLKLWDIVRGREVGLLPVGLTRNAFFSADGKSLLTSGTTGVRRWEVRSAVTSTGEAIRIGPAHLLRISGPDIKGYISGQCGFSSDGRTVAVNYNRKVVDVLDTREGIPVVTTATSDQRLDYIAISPDKRYIATSRQVTNVLVWDGKTGKKVMELPTTHQWSYPEFSPDGRWLIVDDTFEYRFWAVPSWRPGFHLRVDALTGTAMSISPDGRLFAAAISGSKLWLGDPVTGRHFATLEWPDAREFRSVCFNANGSLLIAASLDALHTWDLRKIRGQLAEMGLDWSAPPIPSDPQQEVTRTLDVTAVLDEVETGAARRDYVRRLEQLIHATPPNAYNYNELAWYYCMLSAPPGNAQQAVALAQKAAQMAPDMGTYRNTLGVAYYRAGQYRQAVEALNDSLRLNKGSALAYDLYFLAMSYQRLDDRQKAQDCYARAVRWHEDQQKLSPHDARELAAFRIEADSILNAR